MNAHSFPKLPPFAALAALVLGAGASPPTGAQAVVATVPTAPSAVAAVVNTVTNKIYVVNDDASGQVTVIDGAANTATAVPVGSYPFAIGLNMATNKVYVSNSASDSVTVIDGVTNTTSTVPVGSNPTCIAVNQTTNRIYVMNQAVDGTISVIDGATDTVVDSIFAGSSPTLIAVDPAENILFAVAESNNKYTVYNPTLYAIDGGTDEISLVVTPAKPSSMVANPVSGQLYATNTAASGLAVVSYANGTITGYRALGGAVPYGAVAVDTATNRAYAVGGSGSVLVVDGTTYATSLIAAGSSLGGIAVNPVTNEIYVTNTTSAGTVTAIDGATGATTSIPVGLYPGAVVVNPVTDRVYVLNGDPAGTVTVIDGIPSSVAPAITSAPQSQVVEAGSPVVFNAGASGRPAPTYQWSQNGVPLADGNGVSGSTGPTLYLASVAAANAGAYTITATSSAGRVTSAAASLNVVSTGNPGRIINLSTRAFVTSPFAVGNTNVIIAGFAIGGQGSEPLVLRGVGPALAGLGVSGALALPTLSIYDAASPARLITKDTGWQAPPSAPAVAPWAGVVTPVDPTAADFTQVGAFALAPGSGDSAVKVSLPAGAYTSQIGAADGGVGIALAEIYDEGAGGPGAQLVNISSRAFVGTGGNVMIAGFVISGSSSQTLLIRASGPALGEFGLSSTLPDPQLLLYDAGKNLVASNTGWGGSSQISSVAALVGAFAWSNPASADSALLVTLAPGSYTAEVNPLSSDGGLALIEVYAVP